MTDRTDELERLVAESLPLVLRAARRAERAAERDRVRASAYYPAHVDAAARWRRWLSQAQASVRGFDASVLVLELERQHAAKQALRR